MSTTSILILALLLDAALGEPRWLWGRLPHPAILMGRAVDWADQNLNRGAALYLRGVATMAGLAALAICTGWALAQLGWLVEVLVTAILLAQRSLVDHVRAVADALRLSPGNARRAVALIVGRDTGAMDGPAISRAAIESAAENFSDGVIAPAFWYLIGGLPGLMLYKITNTADSMIGHRTPRHAHFGWAAARLDDLLNIIPARLTALLIAIPHGLVGKRDDIARDARLHRSPNAGWPEAAMARALNVALAGPRSYNGVARSFPFVHPGGAKHIGSDQIEAACTVLWRSWSLAVICLLIVALIGCLLPH